MELDEESIKNLLPEAEQGNVESQLGLGQILIFGGNSIRDVAKGLRWIHRSAEQGHPRAQFYLARLYALGDRVPIDQGAAAKWFRKAVPHYHQAAEMGDEYAATHLAFAYSGICEGIADPLEAYAWECFASASGDEAAAVMLARFPPKLTREQIERGKALASERLERRRKNNPPKDRGGFGEAPDVPRTRS